jgi:hypothetical protein
MSLSMFADLRLSTAQQRTTGQNLPPVLCHDPVRCMSTHLSVRRALAPVVTAWLLVMTTALRPSAAAYVLQCTVSVAYTSGLQPGVRENVLRKKS